MVKRFRFGLKLWSTNLNYIEEAKKLYNDGVYNYIELYIVPNTFNDYIKYWEEIKIPFIIHAPHYGSGLNLSIKENRQSNIKLINEVQRFTEKLQSNYIIVHPGVNGKKEETIKQLIEINDNRILIENKPFLGLNDELCIGHSPEDIKFILNYVKNIGFCLDIGHAICSANYQKKDMIKFLKKFIELNPLIYHLTDGDKDVVYDKHYHYGEGTYPIKKLLDLIPDEAMITNEAKKKSNEDLNDFINDINYLKIKIRNNK